MLILKSNKAIYQVLILLFQNIKHSRYKKYYKYQRIYAKNSIISRTRTKRLMHYVQVRNKKIRKISQEEINDVVEDITQYDIIEEQKEDEEIQVGELVFDSDEEEESSSEDEARNYSSTW